MPKISVIMAVYNAEEFLSHSIQSVLEQSFADWELICVDDGSVDGSLAYLNNIAKIDSRVKVLTQANAGPAQARARGIELATGEYGVTLDADDFLSLDFLDDLYRIASRNGEKAVLCNLMRGVGDNPEDYNSFNNRNGLHAGDRLSDVDAFSRTFPWSIHGWCLWRMDLLKTHAVGVNSEINNYNSDEYISRVLFLNAGSIVVGNGKYFYRDNPASITSKISLRLFGALETNSKLFELAKEHNLGLGVENKIRVFQFLTIFSLQRTLYKSSHCLSMSENAEAQMKIDKYLAALGGLADLQVKNKLRRLIRMKFMRGVLVLNAVVKRILARNRDF